MGRATRWLKSLFGLKKEKTNSGGENERMRPDSGLGRSGRETGGLCLNPNTIPPNITPAEAAWLKSFYCDSEKEQNKHAIAVAAATAAAADAAVAAAQAAVAVVRLTSQGRGGGGGGGGGTMFGSREKRAAIRIQTVFRGYLARKAHRALKGLVKLQALVRGYLVRKQATATLHSMQALIRAQASVRAHRTRGLIHHVHTNETSQPQFPVRKSVERFDEANKSVNSSRLSASFDSTNTSAIEESSTKIVEVDTGTGRPKSRSRRTNTDSGDESSCQTLPSPRFYRHPARLSVPADCRNSQESEWWGLTGEECRGYCTAQSTPRFASGSCGGTTGTTGGGGGGGGGVTPGKSISIESLFRSMGASPNYMASTQSFKAKLRSQSAPKQRPEPGGSKRRISSSSMESRNSVSGVRMQRSCSQVQEVLNFKNAVMGRIGRSVELVRQPQH